jgi:hypothetical protein
MRSSTTRSAPLTSSAGHRGQQGDLVVVQHGSVDAPEVPHVVVVDVDVEEPVQGAVVVEQLALDRGKGSP